MTWLGIAVLAVGLIWFWRRIVQRNPEVDQWLEKVRNQRLLTVPRRRSLRVLERRALKRVRMSVQPSVKGALELPDAVEVRIAEEDYSALGPLINVFEEDLTDEMRDLAVRGPYKLRHPPAVKVVADSGCAIGNVMIDAVFSGGTQIFSAESDEGGTLESERAWLTRLDSSQTEYLLEDSVVHLGRLDLCSLVLSYPDVSRWHCSLFRRDGRWIIEDNHSSNGTFLNGERIRTERSVRNGDVILLGRSVSLRFSEVSAITSSFQDVETQSA